ncbi:MAG TPA: hypothetical protein VFR40_05870 [Lapillicoccus sp.]|nr:hypothetical protein [Lapillicoccus sp.]
MRSLRYASVGLLLGVGWGVAARIWMRLISTEPSFSWAGTLMILGMSGIAGLLLGLVFAARRRGGSRWWRLLALPVPLLFAGAGLPLLPAVVGGGWGLRRGPVARVVAVVALLSAPALLLYLTWQDVETTLNPYPDNVFRAVMAAGALLLSAAAAWGATAALGPWSSRVGTASQSEPGSDRIPIG